MYTYKAVCTRVIDGDTVELLINLGFNITHKIRGEKGFEIGRALEDELEVFV
jgi:hypothetical protein